MSEYWPPRSLPWSHTSLHRSRLAHLVSGAALLVAWCTLLVARPPNSPLADQQHLQLLLAIPATAGVLAVALLLVEESFFAWWATAGVAVSLGVLAAPPGHHLLPALIAVSILLCVHPAGHVRPRNAPLSNARGWVIATLAASLTTLVAGPDRPWILVILYLFSYWFSGLSLAALSVRRALVHPAPTSTETQSPKSLPSLHVASHISCFAGTAGKQVAMLRGGAVVSFAVAAGVAVVAGDPLVPATGIACAVDEFVALCSKNGWIPCFYQTMPRYRAAYINANLRLVTLGEEAIVDLDTFSLSGRHRANLRHEVARAKRATLAVSRLPAASLPATSAELEAVSDAWLRGRGAELGFSLGRLEDVDARSEIYVVRGASGRIEAFSTWVPMGPEGIALDLLRRRPDAPAGASDLCIVTALQDAALRGVRVASLGLAPFRTGGDLPADHQPMANAVRSLLFSSRIRGYRYRTLARFKDKFAPRWEARDIAFPRGLSAPWVLAGLIAVHNGHRGGRAAHVRVAADAPRNLRTISAVTGAGAAPGPIEP